MDNIPGRETRSTSPWCRKNVKRLVRLNISVSYLQPGATARRYADVLDVIPSSAALTPPPTLSPCASPPRLLLYWHVRMCPSPLSNFYSSLHRDSLPGSKEENDRPLIRAGCCDQRGAGRDCGAATSQHGGCGARRRWGKLSSARHWWR